MNDRQEILKELFKDAVAVGAFSLPSSYRPEDFRFSVSGRSKQWDGLYWRLNISLKDKTRSTHEQTMEIAIPEEHATIRDNRIPYCLEKLAEGIRLLVDAVERGA